MDNIFQNSDFNLDHIDTVVLIIIKLNKIQAALYKSHYLEIHDVDGTVLECIGKLIQRDQTYVENRRMYNQLHLVESLLDSVNGLGTGSVQLPNKATASMVDLLVRMQNFCAKHIK